MYFRADGKVVCSAKSQWNWIIDMINLGPEHLQQAFTVQSTRLLSNPKEEERVPQSTDYRSYSSKPKSQNRDDDEQTQIFRKYIRANLCRLDSGRQSAKQRLNQREQGSTARLPEVFRWAKRRPSSWERKCSRLLGYKRQKKKKKEDHLEYSYDVL